MKTVTRGKAEEREREERLRDFANQGEKFWI